MHANSKISKVCLEVCWNSLEQNIWVVLEDKLSTTTVVFFRSEMELKCKHLYGFRKPKKC